MPPKKMSKDKIESEKRLILNNALTIVGKEGYRGISMRKIAECCNFSHAKIYYYFSNKDEIIFTLVDNGFDMLMNKVVVGCEKESTNKAKFITCLKQLYLFGINESNYFNLMFGIEVPKCSDFLSKKLLNHDVIAQKEKAIEFYNFYSNTTQNYARSINIDLNQDEILNIFIQISGIVWLENAKLLQEIGHDKDTLFNVTLNNIISFLNLK